ncbi:MAG: uroporphyrinogen-III C-methyltransferase [Acidobacteriota bacterium]|nr:uroporphyrinogen-III C-methyltransferase [Acidobacteriota bacterium]
MSKVYLVGAGPGDPDLITWKGRRLLARADSVLYDNLVNHALLDLAPAHAEKVYVGKKKAAHSYSQEEIRNMLIERARRGLTVVRLKGGDPFIFGRGGEEAEALADAGIPFEVVPGVTSPLGIAAYAGVPLTHRDHTSVVTFVTGHEASAIDWNKVGHAETLVIFMGLTSFDQIAAELIARGRGPETPCIAVRWGTRPDQEVIAGTLADLPQRIHELALKPPATIIVGEVVRLREKLNWYERLPLFGKTIVNTRAREQASTLSEQLHELGANAEELPAIDIRPASDYAALDRAIEKLPEYGWLIFTSANGVRFFLERLDVSKRDMRSIRGSICAIGPATRGALEELHLKVDLMGDRYVAESLLKAFEPFDIRDRRILIARAAVARDVLPAGLAARGARVEVVEAYRTVVPESLAARAGNVFSASADAGRRPDWITFTSSSTVKNLMQAIEPAMLSGVKIASIGPVTSATARECGLEVTVEASEYTVSGLVEAIIGT